MSKFKVDYKRLMDAMSYIREINQVQFDELDLSVIPEIKAYSQEELDEFKYLSLSNTTLLEFIVNGEKLQNVYSNHNGCLKK